LNANQAPVAKYIYDSFGNLIAKSGPLADANVYRFSSKEYHSNSGLYYYGFRFYDPNLQRWLNRDPIGERGGINLYAFVGNSPINRRDPLGLAYGNPISGPSGPVGPSDPYSPGLYYPSGPNYIPPPTFINNPADALLTYLLGDGSPAQIGLPLRDALSRM